MNEDPLEQLKRDIEREQYDPYWWDRVEIDLDHDNVAQGGCLTGSVLVHAGDANLTISLLLLTLNGWSPALDALDAHPQCLGRDLTLFAGESRRFPFRIDVPSDTPLGTNHLDLLGWPQPDARATFRVDPEEPFGRVARALAEKTGQEIAAWFNGRREGDGMFVQMRPAGSERLLLGPVGMEMRMRGGALEGTLILDEVCPTALDVLRTLFKSNRRRIPFRLPFVEPENAAEELLVLLSQSRSSRDLPLPAAGKEQGPDQLPVPHEERQ